MDKNESQEFIFGKEVDLHCFPPNVTTLVIREFIKQAVESDYKEIVIIHGKGRSQKKKEIYRLLDDNDAVKSYGDGGSNWGRTIVYLH